MDLNPSASAEKWEGRGTSPEWEAKELYTFAVEGCVIKQKVEHRVSSAVKPMVMLLGAPLGELPKAEGLPWTFSSPNNERMSGKRRWTQMMGLRRMMELKPLRLG